MSTDELLELRRLRRENKQLRTERDILKTSGGLVGTGERRDPREGFEFVKANQAAWPVRTMCRVLGLSPSSYYAWLRRGPSPRARRDAQLTERIKDIWSANREVYGRPRIHAEMQVRPLANQREALLWREYVDRYHYLGYTPLPGAQLRYLVTSGRQVLALLGFGASAWKAAPRDRFIGWSVAQREARLQLVVNNARFLILPWVQVRNLASTVLARSSRRLPDDWQARYGYRPLLLETFVQSDRFAGTSYRAANWTHVGQTQGRGKLDVHRTHALPRKDIWLYPLRRDFRRRLCAPLNPPPHA